MSNETGMKCWVEKKSWTREREGVLKVCCNEKGKASKGLLELVRVDIHE